MRSKLTIFKNEEFGAVRTIMLDGEVWFVAKDVAIALGYKNYSTAIDSHCNGILKLETLQTTGGMQNINIIPEKGIYRLIMRSNLPNAIKFQDWVCDEVLPSIRKTGSYSVADSYTIEDPVARAERWIEEKKAMLKLESENRIMKPKAEYFDALVDRKLLTNFRDTAKEFGIKQNDFIAWLLNSGYIYRDLRKNIKPYADSVTEGLLELKEYTRNGKTGNQTLITPKGRETFRLLLEKK